MADSFEKKIVVLGTGGTIAGLALDAHDNVGYVAAQIGVGQLLDALPKEGRPGLQVVSEQVSQLDSKDMSFATWLVLARRCAFWLDDPLVVGVVVTHGTDTMEETAFFLDAVLGRSRAAVKPLVLTGAMRPASALTPDGPQNMQDALTVAGDARAHGVLVVFAGKVHAAVHVHKLHPYRLGAFCSGEAGLLGLVEEGRLRLVQALPSRPDTPATATVGVSGRGAVDWTELLEPASQWPRVEIVTSHAGSDGLVVDALLDSAAGRNNPVRGIVVAGTGNGSVHQSLELALTRAHGMGVAVVRSSRCGGSATVANPSASWPDANGLSPVKARIALMLELMAADAAGG
jgi:L-asparaginase